MADTHTAIWYVFDDPKLSKHANSFLDEAEAAGLPIAVSSISLAEIVYLVEKKRVPASAYDDVKRALARRDVVLEEFPLTASVVDAMRLVPRESVPDLPARIVAATAIHLDVPVISRDGRIRTSAIPTIW